ncbi:hypothetical protein BD310DRAFT_938042 [Dichomitus squalens]|uniref:Copper-fist domain-containing protein n=1 Tax=Dichomitus squalens TaxID=114155 RepID=A0A4Q9PHW8_9APHY|nr:hypothetical protein BD310DRAFT_938042 [Dichomitus squalens]
MVYVNDKKFACESCIKGHRSSGCQHADRPLFEVKKKGRPVSQCDKCRELRKTKRMHGKCTCSSSSVPGTLSEAKAAGSADGPMSKSKSRRFKPIAPALPNGLKDVPTQDTLPDACLNLCRCGGKDASICTCAHDQGPSMRTDNGGLAALAQAALFCCGDDLPSASTSTSRVPSNSSERRTTAGPTEDMFSSQKRSCCSTVSRPPSPTPKRTKRSGTTPALSDQHIPRAPRCCSASSTPVYASSFSHAHTTYSAPPVFPAIHLPSASASIADSGCCCGAQCACPGCVQHRGSEHAAKDILDCEEGECRTCVDHDGGVALPEHALAFSQGRYGHTSSGASAVQQGAVSPPALVAGSSSTSGTSNSPTSARRARGDSVSYIDAFLATAASLPLPPPGRTRAGALDPTNVLVYPKSIFEGGDAERRSLFGLVEVPKLQCSCPGGCGCPEGQCACGEGCTGCAPEHGEVDGDGDVGEGEGEARSGSQTIQSLVGVGSCCSR